MLEKKLETGQPFVNNIGEVIAVVETGRHSILKKGNFKIIRNTNCNYLVKDVLRCERCSSTRSTLRAIRSRKVLLQNPTSPDSNINYRFLSKDELIKRLENAQSQRQEALKKTLPCGCFGNNRRSKYQNHLKQ